MLCLATGKKGPGEMKTAKRVEKDTRGARLATWGSLCLAAAGVLLFGSVVGAVGAWMEGRQLQTVAPWAIPGFILATVASLVAMRALRSGKGYRTAVLLALAVATSVLLLFLVNPPTAPPVP